MSRQSITLTPPNDDWLKSQVASEEFSTKSEVVNNLIRKARREQEELQLIRAKLSTAEKSGMSHRSPEQIRESARKRLRGNGQVSTT